MCKNNFTYAHFTHWAAVVVIGSDDDVNVFDDTLESLEQFLRFQLQLEQSAVHFVHEQDGLNTLSNSLTQYSFSLYTHT